MEVEDTRGGHNGKVSFFPSHGTNRSCGVIVLVRRGLDVKSIEVDVQGRFVVIMVADVQGSNFVFVNIYAPNKVEKQCYFLIILIISLRISSSTKNRRRFSRLIPTSTAQVATLLRKIQLKTSKIYTYRL